PRGNVRSLRPPLDDVPCLWKYVDRTTINVVDGVSTKELGISRRSTAGYSILPLKPGEPRHFRGAGKVLLDRDPLLHFPLELYLAFTAQPHRMG
ncbi:unnamed protein product, partial [Mycena citricolor]